MLCSKVIQSISVTKCQPLILIASQKRSYITLPLAYNTDKDPAPYFFSAKVQNLLKYLTRPDNSKIFRKRTRNEGRTLEPPRYEFLTQSQLEEEMNKMQKRAEELLQMPPVVKVHEHVDKIISKDPALTGFDTASFVFTDISYNLKEHERLCVVRETDGTLKHAEFSLKKRMMQTYYPAKERSIREPSVFVDDACFNRVLEKKEYEYLLDRVCIQYEPEELRFQEVCAKVYQHCNVNTAYNILRSTRHFGPMVFYLAWHNSIDVLLSELLETGFIREPVTLISLQRIIHPNMVETDDSEALIKTILKKKRNENNTYNKNDVELDNSCLNCIENYIMKNSTKKGQHQLALQGLRESYEQTAKSAEQQMEMAQGGL